MIMRLIDADAVIKEQRSIMESLYGGTVKVLKKHMDIDDDLSVPMHGMEGYAKAKQFFYGLKGILETAQTVSAQPVIYCKDCKHSYITVDARCCSYGAFYDVAVPDDFFCALAERKDGDDNAVD